MHDRPKLFDLEQIRNEKWEIHFYVDKNRDDENVSN